MSFNIIRSNQSAPRTRALGIALAASLMTAPLAAVGGFWVTQGPAPITGAQVENVVPGNEAVGAIHTVIAHPTNPDVLFAGGVNGGIWRTTNATDSQPNWRRLTDRLPSQSIGALSFDPTDRFNRTLWAGIGRFSSFGRSGMPRIGLLRSRSGGFFWRVIDGGGTLVGKNISGIAPRGRTIVVSVDNADNFVFAEIGIWRSTDGGASFTQIAMGDGSATGLPGGVTSDLVGDPNNNDRLFTSVVFADGVGGSNGIYRSDDTGATWTKVSDAAIDSLLISGTTSNVEFSVGEHNNVYAAIANAGRLAGLFRSGDGGDTWAALDLPQTIEDGGFAFGIHPGGQASIHMSLAADPGNENLLYIAGDRQPFFGEGSGNPVPFFPNSIGAANFSGRLFRVDASLPAGSQATHLTHSNTDSNSSPHADSREMTFDAAGRLIETDDGGIYARLTPQLNTGDWISLNGDIETNETHDNAYDTLSDVTVIGTQDNGTDFQATSGSLEWNQFISGDGGDTQVDNQTIADQSIRYTSAQVIQALNRSFWDATNTFLGFQFLALTPLDGGAPVQGQFSTPIELNAVDKTRLVIAGANSLYESLDQGDTVREIAPGLVGNGTFSEPLSYGGAGNPDIIYVGSGDSVFIRTGPDPAPVAQSLTFPGTGSGQFVRDIVIDPSDANHAFVVSSTNVFETADAGATWTDITGDIVTGADAVTPFRSIEYIPNGFIFQDVLVVGGTNGVFSSRSGQGFDNWRPYGFFLPNVPVFDLDYDAEDKLLWAGTLGRGNWKNRSFFNIGEAEDDKDR